VSGLLGYAFTRFPSMQIQVFFIPVRASIFGPVAVALTLYWTWAPGQQSVGHACHLGFLRRCTDSLGSRKDAEVDLAVFVLKDVVPVVL